VTAAGSNFAFKNAAKPLQIETWLLLTTCMEIRYRSIQRYYRRLPMTYALATIHALQTDRWHTDDTPNGQPEKSRGTVSNEDVRMLQAAVNARVKYRQSTLPALHSFCLWPSFHLTTPLPGHFVPSPPYCSPFRSGVLQWSVYRQTLCDKASSTTNRPRVTKPQVHLYAVSRHVEGLLL